MAQRIANAEDIIARADVLSVVQQFVPDLTVKGRAHAARCPFHHGEHKSFQVNPERGTWTCWSSCRGSGQTWTGDALAFVCRWHNLDRKTDFAEAVEILADITGQSIQWEEYRGRAGAPSSGPTRAELYDAINKAHAWYREQLAEHEPAVRYLAERGFGDALTAQWEFGYARGNGRADCGAPEAHLVAAGVLKQREDGSTYDPLAGRVIIPLRSPTGRVVGFAGRCLESNQTAAKYLNTAETALYRKRECLFGYSAASQMDRERPVLVLEGQLKAIAAQTAGYRAVAPGGTGLDSTQAALIARLNSTVWLAYDADDAGRQATVRAASTLRRAGLDVQVATLRRPDGLTPAADKLDPDDLLAVGQPIEYIPTPYLDWLVVTHTNLPDATAAARAVSRVVLPAVNDQPDPLVQITELRHVAKLTHTPMAVLQGAAIAARPAPRGEERIITADERMTPGRMLVSALLLAPVASPYTGDTDAWWWVELVNWIELPLELVRAIRAAAAVRQWMQRHSAPVGPAIMAAAGAWQQVFLSWTDHDHPTAIGEDYLLGLQEQILTAERDRAADRRAAAVASGTAPITDITREETVA